MHVQMRQALSTSARHRQHTSARAAQHVASFALDGRCFDELAPQLAALSLGQIGLPARAAHAPPMHSQWRGMCAKGKRWFCSDADAEAAGWRHTQR